MEKVVADEGGESIEWFDGDEARWWESFSPAGLRCLAAWASRKSEEVIERRLASGQQLVYFARAGGRVKIGTSLDVRKRLGALQTGCPEPLKLLHVEVGGEEREKVWHERFRELRVQGEWFSLRGRLAEMLGFPSEGVAESAAAWDAEEVAELAEQRAQEEERVASARRRSREARQRAELARREERLVVGRSVSRVLAAWDQAGSWIPDGAEDSIEKWLERIPEGEMIRHVKRVHSAPREGYWRYFCGVMWKIYRGEG